MVQQQTEPPVSEGASQPPVSEEERKRIQDAYEYGADLMRERKTYKQIVRALEIRGLDTATAEALAQNLTGLRDTRSKTERGPAYQKMLIGVLMVCAGGRDHPDHLGQQYFIVYALWHGCCGSWGFYTGICRIVVGVGRFCRESLGYRQALRLYAC